MPKLTGSEVSGLMEAYNQVYAPVELTEEEFIEQVEYWVNTLIEEGYDLSEYTWDDMYLIAEDAVGRTGRSVGQSFGQGLRDDVGAGLQGNLGTKTTSSNPLAQAANLVSRVRTAPIRGAIRFGQGVAQGVLGGGGGMPKASPKTGGVVTKPSAKPIPNVSNIPPKEGTGRGGPSDINRKTGGPGGTASGGTPTRPQTQPSRTSTAPTPRPTGAPPTVKVAPNAPSSGGMSYGGGYNPPPNAPAGGQSTMSKQAADLRAMQADSRKRQGLTQSFDAFDLIKGHLLDEGYADTEEAALAIMTNMSEEWKHNIVEGSYEDRIAANNKKYDRNRQRAAQRAAARNEARKAGKTGNVPGVGYVSSRPEGETYRDSAGTERHHTGGKMPKKD